MRIGVLGAGQLAMMMAEAGKALGHELICLDPAKNSCARSVADVIEAPLDDEAALQRFADLSDVITIETENVPLSAIDFLRAQKPLYPSCLSIATAQDRLLEKRLSQELGIATAPFCGADSLKGLQEAVKGIGTPAVVKTRRLGYDGKGQFLLSEEKEAEKAWSLLQERGLIVEKLIPFDYEVSILAAASRRGEQLFYPLVRNHHEQGILRYSIAPWIDPQLFDQAREIASKLLSHFSYVGVLAVEFFALEGKLLLNEMAPRVHNSGHWTIEGALASQFENHLRAITGMPLGSVAVRGRHVMFNHIGSHPERARVDGINCAHFYDYRKEARPNRKLGHVTLSSEDKEEMAKGLEALQPLYPHYSQQPLALLQPESAPLC